MGDKETGSFTDSSSLRAYQKYRASDPGKVFLKAHKQIRKTR